MHLLTQSDIEFKCTTDPEWEKSMFMKFSLAVAVAFLAFAPSASFAAAKKSPHPRTQTTENCAAGGCENVNPDRVQVCAGGDPTSCYKRTRTHHKHHSS
jgi:hypothetical protein